MSDLPSSISIHEVGPREGFQFEKGPIPTERKIELVDALSASGLRRIQVTSFVRSNSAPYALRSHRACRAKIALRRRLGPLAGVPHGRAGRL